MVSKNHDFGWTSFMDGPLCIIFRTCAWRRHRQFSLKVWGMSGRVRRWWRRRPGRSPKIRRRLKSTKKIQQIIAWHFLIGLCEPARDCLHNICTSNAIPHPSSEKWSAKVNEYAHNPFLRGISKYPSKWEGRMELDNTSNLKRERLTSCYLKLMF